MKPKHCSLELSNVKTKEINKKKPQRIFAFIITISLLNSLMKKMITIMNTL